MSEGETIKTITTQLKARYQLSEESIKFLQDKGIGRDKTPTDWQKLQEILRIPDQTFEQRRKSRTWLETLLDQGDSPEMTIGRHGKNVAPFADISSEQATMRERLRFGVEYIIALADTIGGEAVKTEKTYPGCINPWAQLIQKPFADDEKQNLRSIYENFRTKDYAAIKLIEDKTKHDIVAANAWLVVRAQQLGFDTDYIRKITHFARTSADIDTNVGGILYTKALGVWISSLSRLIGEIRSRAEKYAENVCIAETHGQKAQLTTLGHIYATLAEDIRQHATPLIQPEKFKLDGKIAGAIGTDVDMKAVLHDFDVQLMYKHLVQDVAGLNYVEFGNDQDCTNAAFCRMLDTIENVGNVIKKAALDTWIYASRFILSKKTEKGESGSSAMPQKANPFLAEGAEALVSIYKAAFSPIKEIVTAYREQGDLRRSITRREGFHYIMLAVIAIDRLTAEMKNYVPNPSAMEAEIYSTGPQVVSSAVCNFLRGNGASDAYDRIKEIAAQPIVHPRDFSSAINSMVEDNKVTPEVGAFVLHALLSVTDEKGYIKRLRDAATTVAQEVVLNEIAAANRDVARRKMFLGDAVESTYIMARRTEETIKSLKRYVA